MTRRLALVLASAVLAAGCHRREITQHDRIEAANMISEAEFAVTIKDFPRAEGLYSSAVKLCPDQGETWIRLGIVRVQLKNSEGARTAYKAALGAFKDEFGADHTKSGSAIRAATVLVILGSPDEARSYIEKALSKVPDDPHLRAFVDDKDLERIIADPELKRISP